MKKYIGGLLVIIAVLALNGCDSKDKETFFIPTPMVTPELSEDELEESTDKEDTSVDDKEPVFVGKTTTMYVKLGDYDAILNIRDLPSREGKVVGFLVHTEEVKVISIEDGWASFLYRDEICYVSADFLEEEKPDYIQPPTPTNKPAKSNSSSNEDPPEI